MKIILNLFLLFFLNCCAKEYPAILAKEDPFNFLALERVTLKTSERLAIAIAKKIASGKIAISGENLEMLAELSKTLGDYLVDRSYRPGNTLGVNASEIFTPTFAIRFIDNLISKKTVLNLREFLYDTISVLFRTNFFVSFKDYPISFYVLFCLDALKDFLDLKKIFLNSAIDRLDLKGSFTVVNGVSSVIGKILQSFVGRVVTKKGPEVQSATRAILILLMFLAIRPAVKACTQDAFPVNQ